MLDRAPDIDTLIVVDQFEEVFTLCRDRDERVAFLSPANGRHGDDQPYPGGPRRARRFLDHCVQDPQLVEALRDAQIAVGPMSSQELREGHHPAGRARRLHGDRPLLAAVVADATSQPGALPLISRDGGDLAPPQRQPPDPGQVPGGRRNPARARADRGSRVPGVVAGAARDVARSLFLRLTALGVGTEDTRRRIGGEELDPGPGTHSSSNPSPGSGW
ncbi:hypothetical protein LT493_22805 [Streptomyces tricolor]|nr:hypothetical protein [Streptomyces tricolor]